MKLSSQTCKFSMKAKGEIDSFAKSYLLYLERTHQICGIKGEENLVSRGLY